MYPMFCDLLGVEMLYHLQTDPQEWNNLMDKLHTMHRYLARGSCVGGEASANS